jgi:hypothetical protein
MTIDPQYPVVTRVLWYVAVQDYPELALTISNEVNRLQESSKTNGMVKRRYINGQRHHYVYRFWADTETAENWIEFYKIVPSEYKESISIVDSSEVQDL